MAGGWYIIHVWYHISLSALSYNDQLPTDIQLATSTTCNTIIMLNVVLHQFYYIYIFFLGRRVAELEMHVLLAQLVRNFKIEFREEEPIKFITKLFYGPGRQMNLAFVDLK